MGRVVKSVTEGSTRYYWYPGEKKEWVRAGIALGAGAVVFGALVLLTHSALLSVSAGASVTAAMAGVNFGRRDARAVVTFPDLAGRTGRRSMTVYIGHAVWRGTVQGAGGGVLVAIIAHLSPRGFAADWVLPLAPALVGGLAHQVGMALERLSESTTAHTAGPAAPTGGTRTPALPSESKMPAQAEESRMSSRADKSRASDGAGEAKTLPLPDTSASATRPEANQAD